MFDLSSLCDVSGADELLVAACTAFIGAVLGAGAKVLPSFVWLGLPIEPMSLSGFGLGCLTPIGLTIALAVVVSMIVPGVEECASTDVIGFPLLALLLGPVSIYGAFFLTSKFSRFR